MQIEYMGTPFEVGFTYYGAQKGLRDSYGAPETPDEDAYIEIESITYHGGDFTDMLNDAAMEYFEQKIWESKE